MVITTIVMTMATMMTIELVKMFSCGASVKVIGTSRGCQRHFRGFRGISWASIGCENAETFNLFSIKFAEASDYLPLDLCQLEADRLEQCVTCSSL